LHSKYLDGRPPYTSGKAPVCENRHNTLVLTASARVTHLKIGLKRVLKKSFRISVGFQPHE
jgi:hypothetical protein